MKYKIIKTWSGEINNFPAFGFETDENILILSELYLPDIFGTQAVLELRDKGLKYIKLIGNDDVSF